MPCGPAGKSSHDARLHTADATVLRERDTHGARRLVPGADHLSRWAPRTGPVPPVNGRALHPGSSTGCPLLASTSGMRRMRKLRMDEVDDGEELEHKGEEIPVVRDADARVADLDEAAGRSLVRAMDDLLTAPLGYEALAAMVLEQFVPKWCEAAVLDWMHESGEPGRLAVATHGRGDALAPLLSDVGADSVTRDATRRVRRTCRTATSVVWSPPVADVVPVDGRDEHDGATRWHVHTLPLRVRGRLGGTLTLVSSARIANGLAAVVARCADRLAPALELARLDARDADEGRVRAPDPRLQLLADVGALTAESLDEHATLQRVVSRLVPEFADIAVVELVEDAGPPGRTEAVASSRQVGEPVRDSVIEVERESASRRVAGAARSWRSEYLPELDGNVPAELVPDARRAAAFGASGLTSYITVPLGTHGQVVGTFSLFSARHNRRFGREDLVLAEELARRMTGVVENARLYHASQLANLAKAEFLAVMSHELRTPLTAILGYGALLREGLADSMSETQRRHLAGIEASGVHLVAMIDEILSFVGMEAGWERIARRMTSVDRLVDGAVAQVRATASRKGLELRIETISIPPKLLVDASKVRRMLVNLLSNAVKFTQRGEISLRVEYEEGNLVFTVRDTGMGIADEHRTQIFEPFWQAEPATTRRVGGVGLGLSVARRIANLLGGSLTMESGPGSGSEFVARVPASR